MRGGDESQGGMFSYISAEARVPSDHPLRPIRAMADAALVRLSPEFSKLYSSIGRPSIAPERLRRFSGHVTNAARSLGLERSHLYKKCRQLGIDIREDT